MTYQCFDVTIADQIAHIVLNRPDKRNSMIRAFWDELPRIVEDIDKIVKNVRFDGWQATAAGERQVKQALRAQLLKYKLHTDQELFDRAYGYIRQYY